MLLSFVWMDNVNVKGIGIADKAIELILFYWLFYKLTMFANNREIKLKAIKKNQLLMVFIFLFYIFCAVSVTIGQFSFLSIRPIKDMIIILSMIIIFIDVIKTEKDFLCAVKVLAITGIVANILLVYGNLQGIDALNGKHAMYGSIVRATGTFSDDPNYAALYTAITIPMSYSLSIYSKKYAYKIFYYFGIISGMVATTLTYSRTGFLCILVFLIIVLRKRIGFLLIILLLGFTAIMALNVDEASLARAYTILDLMNLVSGRNSYVTEHSFILRYSLLIAGVNMLINNFFIGVGLGNFQLNSVAYGAILPQVAHNTYLTIASEVGVGGIVLYLFSLYRAWSNYNFSLLFFKNSKIGFLVEGLRISFLEIIVGSIFLTAQYEKILWILIAFSIIIINILHKKENMTIQNKAVMKEN